MKSIVLGRHVAGIFIVALAYPFMMYGTFDVISWVAAALVPMMASGVATGLLALFFTSSQAPRSRENFLLLSWVAIGLALLGTPRGESIVLLLSNRQSVTSVQEVNPFSPRATFDGTRTGDSDSKGYFDDTQKCDPNSPFADLVPACREYSPLRK